MAILGLSSELYPKAPEHFDIEQVIRPNILSLQPYRCARDDYSEGILLDANENALGHSIARSNGDAQPGGSELEPELQSTLSLDLHRYPSPRNDPIRERLAAMRGLPGPEYVFLGVGSDEVIDLLMRVCVAPGREKVLTTPPTYGMYAVCAQVNDVGVVKVPLELSGVHGEGGERGRFSLKVDEVRGTSVHIRLLVNCVLTAHADQESGRCRSIHQAHHVMLTRQSHWDPNFPQSTARIAGLPNIQGNRDRRRSIH